MRLKDNSRKRLEFLRYYKVSPSQLPFKETCTLYNKKATMSWFIMFLLCQQNVCYIYLTIGIAEKPEAADVGDQGAAWLSSLQTLVL